MLLRITVVLSAVALLGAISSARADGPLGPVCEFPDISTMTAVPVETGASAPAGTGGDIPGGRWELIEIRHAAPAFITIVGEGTGALELEADDPTSGYGSVALDVELTQPSAEQINETGAGPYSATGTVLSVGNDCGDDLLLGEAEYSVDTSGPDPVMILWGSIEVTDPIPTSIPIETRFLLTEPSEVDDPVFADRFEQLQN